jgi:hypothetical protein
MDPQLLPPELLSECPAFGVQLSLEKPSPPRRQEAPVNGRTDDPAVRNIQQNLPDPGVSVGILGIPDLFDLVKAVQIDPGG